MSKSALSYPISFILSLTIFSISNVAFVVNCPAIVIWFADANVSIATLEYLSCFNASSNIVSDI